MNLTAYWDNLYKTKGHIWGNRHTEAAEISAQFYKDQGVKTVLEIGCGYGRDLIYLTQQGFICTGLDLSAEAIEMAKATVDNLDIRLINGDLSHPSLSGTKYDAIFICNLFHLLNETERGNLIAQIVKFLNPDGVLTGMTLSVNDPQDYGKGEPCGLHAFRAKDGRVMYFFTKEMVKDLFPPKLFSLIGLYEIPYHEIFASGEEHHHIMWFIKASAI
ncbi:MAG: class I SAM-dependent methyltransferase [Candidatus Schekmanbacteria bacterium]|nr:class I SAM-dependent methyltransferase [Candidatus Schekmanbacteria bacterium]